MKDRFCAPGNAVRQTALFQFSVPGAPLLTKPSRRGLLLEKSEAVMELWVNGKQVEPGPLDEQMELEAVLDLVASEFTPQGETVTEVLVDGVVLSVQDQRARAGEKVSEMSTLEVVTHNPTELAYETLKEGASYVEKLVNGMGLIVERYRANDSEEGSRLLALGVEGIQWFTTMIEKAERFVPIDYSNEEVEDTTVIEHFKNLQPFIDVLSSAQLEQRWDDMAGLIESQMIPYFEKWQRIVAWMIEQCEASRDA